MPATRLILLVFLSFLFCACKDSGERQNALMSEANTLIKRDTDVTQQWTKVFQEVFTTENRAKFPSNRDFFRTHAVQINKLVDESSSNEKLLHSWRLIEQKQRESEEDMKEGRRLLRW